MTGPTHIHLRPRASKDEWWEEAACQGSPWVAEADRHLIVAAKRVCEACPVTEDCLREALAMEARLPLGARVGVAGGLSKIERYNLTRGECNDCGVKVDLGIAYCETHRAERRAASHRRFSASRNARSRQEAS